MIKNHVKAGDEVVVIAGNAKGKHARVMQVLPRQERVLLEALEEGADGSRWINPIKKHERKSEENTEGGYSEREAPIHISNVMKKDKWEARQAKTR